MSGRNEGKKKKNIQIRAAEALKGHGSNESHEDKLLLNLEHLWSFSKIK